MQLVVKGTKWGRIKYALGYIVDAHSLHFQIATGSGIPGLIAWIFLLTMIFRETFYVLLKSKDRFRYFPALGVFSGLVFFYGYICFWWF